METKNLSTSDLQQFRANAHETACSVWSNRKEIRNDEYVVLYDAELVLRGVPLDKTIVPIKNGNGSY